ncbi:DUF1642 domain-containing protein [Enterococcus hirae]
MELSKEQNDLLNRMLSIYEERIDIRMIIDTFDDYRKSMSDPINKMSDEDYWETLIVLIEQTQLTTKIAEQLDEPHKPVVPEFVAEWFERNKDDLEYAIWELCVDSYNAEDEQGMFDWIQCSENKPIETLIRMKDGYEVQKEPMRSNKEEYLTVEQYDYARKTGDWESGKTFNHRKNQSYINDSMQETIDEEILKEELEEHFTNLENIELIANESFKPLYESLVRTLKKYFMEESTNEKL